MRKTHLVMLAIIVAAIVFALGAVTAFATCSDEELPVTTANAAAATGTRLQSRPPPPITRASPTSTTRSTGDRRGSPSSRASRPSPAHPSPRPPLAAGPHDEVLGPGRERQRRGPELGNFTVATDTAKPVTAATGATDGSWYKAGVTVQLAASDGADESGVQSSPTRSTAPLRRRRPRPTSPSRLSRRAHDRLSRDRRRGERRGRADLHREHRHRQAADDRVGRVGGQGPKGTLKYKVAETEPTLARRPSRSRSGTAAARSWRPSTPARRVNTAFTAKFRWKLAKGAYRFSVYATDASGNAQAKAGSARLKSSKKAGKVPARATGGLRRRGRRSPRALEGPVRGPRLSSSPRRAQRHFGGDGHLGRAGS